MSLDDFSDSIFDFGPSAPLVIPEPAEFNALLQGYVDSGLCTEFERVGSRVTCDPPPTDTDEDFLVLTHDIRAFRSRAEIEGFKYGGSDLVDEQDGDYQPTFASLKLGHINLIVTECDDFYRRFLAASSVAKRLNLLNKYDRVSLFQAVLYGNPC